MGNLVRYQFKPGQSGNPGGRLADPALRRLQKQIRAKRPLLLQTLDDCLKAKSRKVRIEALKLAFLYGFGKPPECVPEPEAADEVVEGEVTPAELEAMQEQAKLLQRNEDRERGR